MANTAALQLGGVGGEGGKGQEPVTNATHRWPF